MDYGELQQVGGKKTISEHVMSLEDKINRLSSLINSCYSNQHNSLNHCKKNRVQNDRLDLVISAYNTSYTHMLDEKIQQMQQMASLNGYLKNMIEDGNFNIDEIKRAQEKHNVIKARLVKTQDDIKQIETLLS